MADGADLDLTTSPQTPSALAAVAQAIPGWVNALLDLTARNDLLFCKPSGKVDLASAERSALQNLIAGNPVRLSALFPAETELAANAKVVGNIRKRMRAFDEEQGVRIGRLVSGFVSWSEPDSTHSRRPNAPMFLRYVTVAQPQPGVDDYVLHAEPDIEVNEVLLHLLNRDFRVSLKPEQVEELADLASEDFFPAASAVRTFAGMVGRVPDLSAREGLVLGTFKYTKLTMVRDLQLNEDVFAESDLVAAVAGNFDAMGRIRVQVGEVRRDDPNRVPPADEFLVLDADPSQNYAINAAIAGRNIVIQGPPGTGKSQTISNLIASAIARDKTVLFVAEKRAAIDAVLDRLEDVGLGSVLLDLHDGAANKSRVCAEIRSAIEGSRSVARPAVEEIHRRFDSSRERLISHTDALHIVRDPWGISVFDAQAVVLDTPLHLRGDLRLASSTLSALDIENARATRELLKDAAMLGAFFPLMRRSAWATATDLTSQPATAIYEKTKEAAQQVLPAALAQYAAAIDSTDVIDPDSFQGWTKTVALFEAVTAINQKWKPDIWTSDLDALIRGCAPRAERKRQGWNVPWRLRREAFKQVKILRLSNASTHRGWHSDLVEVSRTLAEWRLATGKPDDLPRLPEMSSLLPAHNRAVAGVSEIATTLKRSDLLAMPLADLAGLVAELARDPSEITKTQRINRLINALEPRGMTGLIDQIREKSVNWTLEEANTSCIAMFDHAWAASILQHIALEDPTIGGFDGAEHSIVASEYLKSDREHRDSTPHRIRRHLAERLANTRNAYPEQERLLDVELRRKRRIKPVRELLTIAPDVILSAKPCWAMSPLVVSQALPSSVKFDFVIFDEASQIRPADAIPALGRARQAVVCGDSKQLPPSSFFDESAGNGDDLDEPVTHSEAGDQPIEYDENLGSLTEDTESILDVFDTALGSSLASQYRLLWHYRSRDARLIAFSDAWFYDKSLLTFPGTSVASPLIFHLAAHPLNQPQNVSVEVAAVVDLALEHARTRPNESLGIIAMSLEHARRIDAALEQRLREEDDLDLRSFFRESAAEPFFVKNLERVQGDERDAIIITMGYIKTFDGRMQYRFGPLNIKGGERRLNVAISRAKSRLTFVSSFSDEDLDPARLNAEGAKALRAYIQYVKSGGKDLGDRGADLRPLNPFEIHVRDHLAKAGIPVVAQYGVAGYWIDFAATHPQRPGQMVLAIEADGASYHSSETARARDRLRQEHLERLGWTFHRIWSTEYFRHPEAEIARVRTAYDKAVSESSTTRSTPEPSPVATVPTTGGERPFRPKMRQDLPIDDYTHWELIDTVKWIMSDDLIRTDEEILDETMSLLGFRRRGVKIVNRISEAIAAYRSRIQPNA